MKLKTILLATDFSENSAAALDYAEILARDTGAQLLIAYCVEPVSATGAEGFYLPELDEAEFDQRLTSIVPKDPAIPYEQRLLRGQPGQEIVQLAEEAKVDMIVMGTHGRRGLSRVLMGSVAKEVVRRAPCPVLTLRQHQPQSAPAEIV